MKKKMLAALLVVMMIFSPLGTLKSMAEWAGPPEKKGTYAVPGTNAVLNWILPFQHEDGIYISNCNDDAYGKLIIPEMIDGFTVEGIVGSPYGDWGFHGCEQLTDIILPSSLKDIQAFAFDKCNGLKSIEIPSSVTRIDGKAFCECSNLENIFVKEKNETYSSVDGFLLDKSGTKLLNFPGGKNFDIDLIPSSVTSIGEYAFYYYYDLNDRIELPANITQIDDRAFFAWDNLTAIGIPSSVTSIGEWVFGSCYNLTDVYYAGSEDEWKKISIETEGNDALLNARIHYNSTEIPENPFNDIKGSAYYYDAVLWAAKEGITAGVDESGTLFAPNANATRGQVVTFLWRAAGCPEPTNTENKFTDVSARDFYYQAILWAVENGITAGVNKEQTMFAPNANATRGEILTFMWRAEKCPQPMNTENKFTDVRENDFYYTPVLWAVENKITSGVNAEQTQFAPKELITRADFVTFLYRKEQN